ncbi:unnamed protein product [Leptidea sinapis]|uniref:CULT domain-containing protein n=1 Tax=Leptidea sinapis TaxID=189913 RepID=A0A5E4PMZ3_9NEOP|nr:unnamed protein product [Leptidea sinapis]
MKDMTEKKSYPNQIIHHILVCMQKKTDKQLLNSFMLIVSSEDEEYSSGAGDADENVPIEQTNEDSDAEEHFDITLAASHSYMGAGLEAIKGRSVLEAGWTGKVPVIAHHGAVFPGETVPMLLTNSHDAAMVHETLRSDKLFGLLCPEMRLLDVIVPAEVEHGEPLLGYMHDILTVRTADNLETSGPPSAEFSWFPGYKWTIMVCRCCMVHIGWRFDAEKPTLRPRRFFALSRNHMQFGARSAAAPPSRDPVRYGYVRLSLKIDLG